MYNSVEPSSALNILLIAVWGGLGAGPRFWYQYLSDFQQAIAIAITPAAITAFDFLIGYFWLWLAVSSVWLFEVMRRNKGGRKRLYDKRPQR